MSTIITGIEIKIHAANTDHNEKSIVIWLPIPYTDAIIITAMTRQTISSNAIKVIVEIGLPAQSM